MSRRLIALAALALAGCGASEANPYPAAAEAGFAASCPMSEPECACTWERITRTLTYEEYAAALAHFRREGLMDTRIVRARTACVERRAG